MVASGGGLPESYGHAGPGVLLGDDQTEAEDVPWQGGRGDALLRRMAPNLTCKFIPFDMSLSPPDGAQIEYREL